LVIAAVGKHLALLGLVLKPVFVVLMADLIKAAHLDGAGIFTTYRRIILPSLKPVFFSAMVILIAHC